MFKRPQTKATALLKTGLSPQKAAWAAALGIILGIFPIYGVVSILALATSSVFRLNTPLILAAVYSMSFVKPLLILPFLKFGEFVFRADPMAISLAGLTAQFAESPLLTMQEFGWSFIHAMVGWAIITPALLWLIYPVTLKAMKTMASRLSDRRTALLPAS